MRSRSSKTYVISVIMREAAVLTVVGVVAGYLGAFILRRVMLGVFPTLPVQLSWDWRLYAAALAFLVAAALGPRTGLSPGPLGAYLFLAAASHGLLDALTDGGLGVAFFSPFDNRRYFLPWRPIAVSPIGVRRFFTASGLLVFESELVAVWLPALVFAGAALLSRGRRQRT